MLAPVPKAVVQVKEGLACPDCCVFVSQGRFCYY